jgi:hypothetical protein
MTHACHLSYVGSINRRIKVPAGPDKKQDPIPKITKAKRAVGVAQVVKCLPSKQEALTAIPSSTRRKKKRKEF